MLFESPIEKLSEFLAPMTHRARAILFTSFAIFVAGVLAPQSLIEENFTVFISLMGVGFALVFLVLFEREAFLMRMSALTKLEVEWRIDKPIVEGKTTTVHIRIRNPTLIPIEHLEVYDSPPRLFRVQGSPSATVILPPGGEAEITYEVTPVMGTHSWGMLKLVIEDPLGFFRAERERGGPIITVQPKPLDIPRAMLSLPTILQPGGIARLRKRGIGSEFMELREYVPGDELRFVEWKAFARTGRLMVKTFEQESFLRVVAVLDVTGTMLRGVVGETKLEYSVRLISSLAEYLARRGDILRVYMVTPRGAVKYTPWLRGRTSGSIVRRFFAENISWNISDGGISEEAARVRAGRIARSLLHALPRGNALIFFVSDFGESTAVAKTYGDYLRKLVERRNQVFVVSPLTLLFEVRALEGITASLYVLTEYHKVKEFREVARTLRRMGIPVVAAGPDVLLGYILRKIEALRGVRV